MVTKKTGELDLPVDMVAYLFSNKWKILIIGNLMGAEKRFNELKRLLKGISAKVLTDNLRSLEEKGLLTRNVIPEIPVKVEYQLTSYGESLYPILQAFSKWGKEYQPMEVTKSNLVI